MRPHIPAPRSIVMYAEKTSTKINKAQMHAQADFLSALCAFYSPMTFNNRSTLQAALLQHSSTSGWLTAHWHNDPKEQALWAKVSGPRLKAMCRHATHCSNSEASMQLGFNQRCKEVLGLLAGPALGRTEPPCRSFALFQHRQSALTRVI